MQPKGGSDQTTIAVLATFLGLAFGVIFLALALFGLWRLRGGSYRPRVVQYVSSENVVGDQEVDNPSKKMLNSTPQPPKPTAVHRASNPGKARVDSQVTMDSCLSDPPVHGASNPIAFQAPSAATAPLVPIKGGSMGDII